MVFEAPLIVMIPALAVKLVVEVRLPVMRKELEVVVDPLEIVRLSKLIPVPEIDLVVPVMVNVPPLACVNVPAPVVAKFPATDIAAFAAAVIPDAEMVRLLKF